MNQELVSLFCDHNHVELLQQKLPRAFEVADAESRRIQKRRDGRTFPTVGQEVGVVRERILVAYLRVILGDLNIELPTANSEMRDVVIHGMPLEIKTASKDGPVTAKWTADTQSVLRDIDSFEFTADLLLVRIWWGLEKDSLFYIPLEVLREIAGLQAPSEYLSSAQGTNNRGIQIKTSFMNQAQENAGTVRISINWQTRGISLDPMGRWMGYWSNRRDRDSLYY